MGDSSVTFNQAAGIPPPEPALPVSSSSVVLAGSDDPWSETYNASRILDMTDRQWDRLLAQLTQIIRHLGEDRQGRPNGERRDGKAVGAPMSFEYIDTILMSRAYHHMSPPFNKTLALQVLSKDPIRFYPANLENPTTKVKEECLGCVPSRRDRRFARSRR